MAIFQIRTALAPFVVLLASLCAAHAADETRAPDIERLAASPDAMSAVMLVRGNGLSFCTLGSNVNGKFIADNDRIAALHAPQFRAWHGKGNVTAYTSLHPGLGPLYDAMLAGTCNVVVESAANIATLLDEIDTDGLIVSVLPSPLRAGELADAYAVSLGFKDNAELLLASHMLASHDELQTYYKLGVTTRQAYDDALARMQAEGYSRDPLQLLSFLKDEAEGMRRNLSATDIRTERLASPSPQ